MLPKRLALALSMLILTGCSSLSLDAGQGNKASETKENTKAVTSTETKAEATSQAQTQPATKPVSQSQATVPATEPFSKPSNPSQAADKDQTTADQWANKFVPGLIIGEVPVGGLTEEEAQNKVNQALEEAKSQVIKVSYQGVDLEKTQDQLGIKYDMAAAFAKAKEFMDGLSESDLREYVQTKEKKVIALEASGDAGKLAAFADEAEKAYNKPVKGATAGRKLDRDKLLSQVEKALGMWPDDNEVTAPVKVLPSPEASKEPTEGQEVLGKGSSRYLKDYYDRAHNIKRAAGSLNGVVVHPGETFSFNDQVGAASIKNGYKKTYVYTGDGLAEGPGGGVCQVSSTLYNAIIRAGLPTPERHNHGYTVTYLPVGMDAAIYYPGVDLKFTNTFDTAVTIRTSAKSGKLKIWLEGDENAKGGYTYKFRQVDLKEGKRNWTIVKSNDLKKGDSIIRNYPHPETSVKIYRKTYLNGKLVKDEHFDTCTYREMKGYKTVGR